MLGLEEALKENARKKEKWLMEELIIGLKKVGVKVEIEEEPNKLNVPFRTILHIENENGKKYSGGLMQKVYTPPKLFCKHCEKEASFLARTSDEQKLQCGCRTISLGIGFPFFPTKRNSSKKQFNLFLKENNLEIR